MLRPGEASHDIPRQVLTGEPHLDPHSRLGIGIEGGGHGILKEAIQVGQSAVDEYPSHRQGGFWTHRFWTYLAREFRLGASEFGGRDGSPDLRCARSCPHGHRR